MAAPVWVLSVDLQARTATFSSGLAEAARNARGAFGDIGSASGEMAGAIGKHSVDVRHSLGLVDNVLRGDHMRAFVDLIRIYSQSAIVMGALPFAAVAGGIALIGGVAYEAFEHFHKLAEEQEKLTDAFTKLGTTGNNAFRELDDQILKAEQHSAELRNDHLAALHIQLELIDHESMAELVKSLGTVQKAADEVFKVLQGNWYSFGIGSAGASHALDEFKTKYENLVSQGKDKDASDLLHGTLESARGVLAAVNQIQQAWAGNAQALGGFESAKSTLERAGLSYATSAALEKEKQAQQALVEALEQQVGIEERVSKLKNDQQGNAKTEYSNQAAAQRSAAARAAAESQLSMGQSAISADKATADAQLDIQNASIEARLASDMDFAKREEQVKLAANQAEIAALDKSGKEYTNQLAALNGKALEIQQQYETSVAELKAKASVEINQRDITALEQGIREQIEATQQGSSARLAAIDAGLREEQARGLQQTEFYRDLAKQRVDVERQSAEEAAKLSADAAKESAENAEKMGELAIAAEKQKTALLESARRVSINQQIADDSRVANEEYQLKMAALEKEIAGLDKSGKDYLNKLKALQDQEKQMTQQHENELVAIKEKAEQESNQRVLAAETQFQNSIASELTRSLMGHQSWAKMVNQLGNQVVSGMIENAIKSMLADDLTKERDAASAARKAYNIGLSIGGPAGIILGPLFGAAAFTAVMAYATGTDGVPGVTRGDVVPAMLTPGEGVVPGGVMDGLRNMARNGGFENQTRQQIHVHVRPTYHVNTIDGDGMRDVLNKHTDVLTDHFRKTVRRMTH
jgi:hypothetical protein